METLKKIGKYKYAERHCLGQGSFGKVYQGTDESGRRVAIKKVQQKMIATDSYLKQSLSTEIAIMKKLKHRNIVELIDTVFTANSIYLILEFCKDGDLKRYSMNKRFSEEQALQILKQLIEGFYLIVKQGIIHRDLKPANVLVHQGVFKICDFGFAKYFGEMSRMAKTCVGTPIYMSPQVLKQKPYTSKSDIWSLGVMYYELLFGKIPFLGRSEDQIFKIITRGTLTIPKCSEESYVFLKNTLVIDQNERWDWNTVFQHFGIKNNKEKPAFYQNLIPLIKGNSDETVENRINNHSLSFQKRQQRAITVKEKIDRFYVNQTGPLQRDDYQPKNKNYKYPKNIFAQDEAQQRFRGPQMPPNEDMKFFTERIYKPEQNQKLRWLYGTVTKLLLKQPLYTINIHSYEIFLHSLVSFTLGQYVKQMTSGNLKQHTKMKKLVMEQERQTLEKLLLDMRKNPPCTDIRPISSIIELEGKPVFTEEDSLIIQELTKFYI